MSKTVAVVTTTIGRNELEKTIISIQNQTYPCQHYVFVDGKEHWHKVKYLEEKYPNVIFTFLPMNTGGKNDIGNGAIHAILPYLLQEDIFCFLDDDNWHDPKHVEYLVKMIETYQLDYAYSLRKMYDENYNFLFDDNYNSLGFWTISVSGYVDGKNFQGYLSSNNDILIDTNSYALTREISFKLSNQWYSGISNDRAVFKELLKLQARGGFTAKRTTNYKYLTRFNYDISQEEGYALTRQFYEKAKEFEHNWSKPTLLIDGELHTVDIEL